ncbi:hypothetical protein F4780DRAFT_784958 [Xylariomycetidae sp. FL0641]|nr:hypothetical protein F4780DRAFT_784958 [Xylariomycetidae sp. FL0641]
MIKLYYDSKSSEKPQTLYHPLRLHPYGRTDAETEAMRNNDPSILRNQSEEIMCWTYEEQIFNEPYEEFYKILTSGARDKGTPAGGKGKGKGKATLNPNDTEVKERSAMIPQSNKPGQPFSHESEAAELKKLREAFAKVQKWTDEAAEEDATYFNSRQRKAHTQKSDDPPSFRVTLYLRPAKLAAALRMSDWSQPTGTDRPILPAEEIGLDATHFDDRQQDLTPGEQSAPSQEYGDPPSFLVTLYLRPAMLAVALRMSDEPPPTGTSRSILPAEKTGLVNLEDDDDDYVVSESGSESWV